MSLIRDFTETLRYDIEARQLEPLRKRGAVWGLPKTPAEYGVTGSAYNSAIPVTYEDLSFMVCYNRLTIASLMGNAHATVVMDLTAEKIETTHDLIPDINRCFDMELTPGDIVEQPVTITFATTSVAITFTPECLWFTGTWAAIKLKGSYQMIEGKLVKAIPLSMTQKYSDVVAVTDVVGNRFRMDAMIQKFDYTPVSSQLEAIPMRTSNWTWSYTTSAQSAAIAAALKTVDGYNWANSSSTGIAWNLYTCAVIYNGPVEGFYTRLSHLDDRALPTLYDARFNDIRKDKSHVMCIQPNPTYNNNLTFTPALIHYGTDIPEEFWSQADRPPVHHWPLYGADLTNKGSSEAKEPFPNIVKVATGTGPDKQMATLLTEGHYPLGITWDTERDFTVSMRVMFRETTMVNEGFFGNASGASAPGHMKSLTGWIPVLHYPVAAFKELDVLHRAISYYHATVVTHVRRGNRYITYLDGKAIRECVINDIYEPWTHFGRSGEYLKASTEFADIKLFDYALNPEQVAKVTRGLL